MERRETPERKALDVPELSASDLNYPDYPTDPIGHEPLPRAEPLPREAPVHVEVTRRPPLIRRMREQVIAARPRWVVAPVKPGMEALRRQWRRFALAVVLGLLLVGLVAVIASQLMPEPQFTTVRQGNLTLSYAATGEVQSVNYDVGAPAAGMVTEVDVTVGQRVTAGQKLAMLDTTVTSDAVSEAQAAVAAAQSQLRGAQVSQAAVSAQTAADLAAAQAQERSALNTCGQNAVCQQRALGDFAAAQARADSANAAAQATVDAAQAQLALAQVRLKTAQDTLGTATLKAPHSGTVAAVLVAAGGTSSAGQPVIRIADLGALRVLAQIGVADVGAIHQGQVARFKVPALGGRQFHGTVTGVSPVGERTADAKAELRYPVQIDVDMAGVGDITPLPGMTADVQIIAAQRFGVTLVPASAVQFARVAGDPAFGGFLTRQQVASAQARAQDLLDATRTANGGQITPAEPGYLLERGADDSWVVKPVVLGISDGASYEIIAGLKPGERIVTGETNSSVVEPTPTPRPTS